MEHHAYHSYGVSLAIWDHTFYPTQVNTPRRISVNNDEHHSTKA